MTPEYTQLVEELYASTLEDRVQWQRTATANQFVVYLKQVSVAIKYYSPDNDPDYCTFTLRDASGQIIDNFWVDQTSAAWDKTRDLYAAARRRALGIDSAVRTILDELRSGRVVGEKTPHPPGDDEDVPF